MEYCVNLRDLKSHLPEGHTDTLNCTLIDKRMGIEGFTLFHGEILPGGGAESHVHLFDQGFYVLSGHGRVRINGKEYDLEAGSAYCAPAGVEHQVIAIGSESLRVLRIDSEKEG